MNWMPPQPPIAFDATPSSLVQEAQTLIDRSRTAWDGVVSSAAADLANATFNNTIRPIIDDENAKLARTRLLRFYASTSPSKELREASHAATTLLNNSDAELLSRPDVFVLVDAVMRNMEKDASSALHLNDDDDDDDGQTKYYVHKLHRAMRMNGCAIPEPGIKETFEQANKRVKELTRKCLENFEEDDSGIWLTAEELDGVPRDYLDRLRKGDGDDNEGKLWVKLKPPGADMVMSYARLAATRKQVYHARCNRLPKNVSLFRELVLARDTVARLLGFPHYLAYKTSQKMVRTPEAVVASLRAIERRIWPAVLRGVDELRSIKAEDESADGAKFFLWDDFYYDRIRDEREAPAYDVDLAEYFELYHTLDGLLSVFGRLFDTRIERITEEQQRRLFDNGEVAGGPFVCHEDVMMYAVWDTREPAPQDSFIGYAYFDLFPHEGKYGHRGNYTIQWGYEQADGSHLRPSVAFVMNYPKPIPGEKPTLLTFGQARQMFHELGHLHHNLLTKAKYASLAFIDRDFVEAPSIMFERFFSNAAVVKDISHHYSYLSPEFYDAWRNSSAPTTATGTGTQHQQQPPSKLTDATAARLVGNNRLRTQGYIDSQAANLAYALFDIAVHSPTSHEELETMDLAATFNRIRTDITGLQGGEALGEGWAWSQGQSVFRMIVSGYDAGYYTYILGDVYALDMWEHGGFAAASCDGLEEGAAREGGRRFWDEVLEIGGRQPEMLTLTRYLGGRAPSMEPYFRWLGV